MILGMREGGEGTRKSGGRENCGWGVLYEIKPYAWLRRPCYVGMHVGVYVFVYMFVEAMCICKYVCVHVLFCVNGCRGQVKISRFVTQNLFETGYLTGFNSKLSTLKP